MTLDELLPTLQTLSRTEKLRLIQMLATELEQQETELEAAIIVGSAHLHSESAAKMMELLEERKQKAT